MVAGLKVCAVAALAAAASFAGAPHPAAEYVPIADMRAKGGGSGAASAAARKKLMAVSPEQLLAPYRRAAGLPAKSAPLKTDREKARDTEGRSLGHYLSAMSALYAVTRDETALDRVDYVVEELYGCAQASSSRDKIFMTVPEGDAFADFSPSFPARTAYAMLKGLCDAHELAGNKRAFSLARGWVDRYREVWWRSKPTDKKKTDQARDRWLAGDWGGLNRSFIDVYRGFGVVDYYHDGWNCFTKTPYFNALMKGEYDFKSEGAESLAPKIWGMYMRHRVTGWEDVRKAAFAYLDYARSLPKYGAESDEATYDLMSLAASAFEEAPSAALMDYVDSRQALLAKFAQSADYVGAADVYAVKSMMCAYSASPRTVWVNQYVPSQVLFRVKRLGLVAETDWPSGATAKFTVRMRGGPIFQRIRFRGMRGATPRVSVNGQQVPCAGAADGYFTVERDWSNMDVISVTLR